MKINCRSLLFFSLLFSTACMASDAEGDISSQQFTNHLDIPLGGNSYQTKGTLQEEITEEGLSTWQNSESEFSVFFRSAQAAESLLELDFLPQASPS